MTKSEIKALLRQPEVIEYLKANLTLNLNVEACKNIYGYDITAEAKLHDEILQEATSCI